MVVWDASDEVFMRISDVAWPWCVQFLEYLEKRGCTSIVRVGSRSRNDAMEKYNLRKLADTRRGNLAVSKRREAILHEDLEALQKTMERLQKVAGETPCWWRGFETFVSQAYPHVAHQLRVPRSLLTGDMVMVVAKGQKLRGDYLWSQWRKGKGPGVLADHVAKPKAGEEDIWAMPTEERQRLRAKMESEYLSGCASELAGAMRAFDSKRAALSAIYDEGCRAVLQEARVIGCTTTGAAIHKALLEDVRPGVVLVEEACEILEAQSLASLSPHTKHLIMIGDHKQLRPKLECYDLSVESGGGHDFNRSLFERLILDANFPHVTLGRQHRMRPELSRLIKPTYPRLEDHPSVHVRPKIRGVADNLVFIDHRVSKAQTSPK